MAEAYWDLEYALQQQGFYYCYDKRLYDRLVDEGADSVDGHLHADIGYQDRLVRFIENHDEPRAAATFPPAKARAAAVATLAQTGARLVHEGQLDGRRVQLPVFLARRPDEEPDADLRAFYERLLGGLRDGVFRTGVWQLGERSGWDGNDSWQNLVCWGWRGESPAQAGRRQPQRHTRLQATSRCRGTTSAGRCGGSPTRHPATRCTSGAATTFATACTSLSARGARHLFDLTPLNREG